MAANKIVGNPTANLFSLLSDDASEPNVVAAPKAKKEAAPKKAATTSAAAAPVVGAAMTPAEKAALREKKAPKPAAPVAERAPRRDPAASDERAFGPRGTGNRGARRAVNAETHGHVAPKRGRDFDRQSANGSTRNPPMKKGGYGKGNWGDDKDAVAVAEGETKPVVEGESKPAEESTEVAEEAAAPAEPEEIQLTLDDYYKQKEAAAAALAAKVGAIQPRKLEKVDLTGAVESKKAADAATPAAATTAAAKTEAGSASRKGTKALDVGEVFRVRVAPVGDDRPPRDGERGRGRGGRGGRGGDRAPRADGDRPPRAPRAEGDRPPRTEGDRPPRAPRAEGDRPPRTEGDRPPRAPRAEGDRPPRTEGERAPRGDRPARGARGGDRPARGGDRPARGGDRPARGASRPLDTTNNRQFPTLGQ